MYLPRSTENSTALLSAVHNTVKAALLARLLLVEDDAEVAKATIELLRDIGLQVVWVPDGKAALAMVE